MEINIWIIVSAIVSYHIGNQIIKPALIELWDLIYMWYMEKLTKYSQNDDNNRNSSSN